MPERLMICCLFEPAPKCRETVFRALFGAVPEWMGSPNSYMLSTLSTGAMQQGGWPPPEPIMNQNLGGKGLFIYSRWRDGDLRFRSCIGLAESLERAVYTMSVPIALLRMRTLGHTEREFCRVFTTACGAGDVAIFIGAELDVAPARSWREAMRASGEPASLVLWIVASPDHVPPDIEPFSAVRMDSAVVWRRRDALDRLGVLTT